MRDIFKTMGTSEIQETISFCLTSHLFKGNAWHNLKLPHARQTLKRQGIAWYHLKKICSSLRDITQNNWRMRDIAEILTPSFHLILESRHPFDQCNRRMEAMRCDCWAPHVTPHQSNGRYRPSFHLSPSSSTPSTSAIVFRLTNPSLGGEFLSSAPTL